MTGINLHHHLENNLNSLEQTINIMNNSTLKKKFIIYSPQIITTTGVMKLVQYLREDSNVEIEHRDILMSAETAEDLLAYRKADLIITLSQIANRSIICTPFKTIENVLFLSDDSGIKEFQSRASSFLTNRKIGFYSDSLISITNIIATTDIIGLVPREAYDFYAAPLNLKQIKIDVALPKVQLFLMYNRASLNNQGFANTIKKITDSGM